MGTRAVGGRLTVSPAPGRPTRGIPGSLGIFGGTFDPIHVGHLAIAEDAREQLGLERVLFVPAMIAPLRPEPPLASPDDRVRMVEFAVAGNPFFGVDPIELQRPGPSFTVDTLELVAARERAAGREPDLWFILSAEQFLRLPQWKSPDRVLQLCRLAVVPRSGAAMPDRAWVESRLPGRADRVTFLDGPLLAVSGTSIRDRLRAGRSVRYLVPEAVISYIEDHGLYRPPNLRTPPT